ncbi:LacI family DNA-binding transcriptional regulator [Halovulum dunhuangense]|uniref:LacI family DNA-binding transcriptional regulator n=1 Tax=Halovulum dunhuangense TaxID=1505036 RepID=A0A849KZR9_9RHOB|nr:LacI family DNA-binding transcriptional regulator [Halovulum dunhuangense]NNU79544.1 LacI family DNA-binding transcriptional regulator [Halovulum dunhuangense]
MARKRRTTGNPTIMDVARAAGVSAITVSRALRTPERVSTDARARVNAAIRNLGYTPDPAAQALASQRSDIIGVLVPSVTNSVFLDTMRGVYEVAETSDFRVQIANTRYSQAEEERLVRLFLHQRPAALIVTGIDQSATTAKLLRAAPCPIVQITEMGPAPFDMMVGFSHSEAARAAARHLVDAGYRRIGFLGARRDARSTRRLSGFRAGLEADGLFNAARVLFAEQPSSVPLGAAQFTELLSRDPQADAVLCNNDDLALGVLFECQRRGIEVPQAFGICGFNDIAAMAVAHPSITSVRTPRREIGRQAMTMILARLADEDPGPMVRDLGFTLIQRDSTRRRPT